MSQDQANEPQNEKENRGIGTVIGDAIINTGDTTVTQSGSGNISIGTARDISLGEQSKKSQP